MLDTPQLIRSQPLCPGTADTPVAGMDQPACEQDTVLGGEGAGECFQGGVCHLGWVAPGRVNE